MRRWLMVASVTAAAGVGLVGAMYAPSFVLSAEPLTPGHANLSNDCLACHALLRGTPDDRCIACHPVAEIDAKRSGSDLHQQVTAATCVTCHTQHHGALVADATIAFAHSALPAELAAACASCHQAPDTLVHQRMGEALCSECHSLDTWEGGRFDHALLAAAETCASCHEAPDTAVHTRSADLACSDCHTVERWEGARFDHGSLAADDVCASCHDGPNDKLHAKSGDLCESCHAVDRWKPATFDHVNYFRFDRKHPDRCDTCHTGTTWETYTCYGCHEHSERSIAREHQEEGIRDFADCVACHRSSNERDAKAAWRQLRSGGAPAVPGAVPAPDRAVRGGGDDDDDDDDDDD